MKTPPNFLISFENLPFLYMFHSIKKNSFPSRLLVNLVAVSCILWIIHYCTLFVASLPETTQSPNTTASFVEQFENASVEPRKLSSTPSHTAAAAVGLGSPREAAAVAPAVRGSHVVSRKSAKMASDRFNRQKSGESLQVMSSLKVHKREKFFGLDFEFFTIL